MYLWVKPELYHESFCQDLPATEGLVMGLTQKAPLASTFGDTIKMVAWKTKPSWYQVSSDDRMIAPQYQQWMAGRLNAREVLTLNASHASLASMPAEIAAFIDKAATALA
ncbi:alpha/beta hydrolase [Pseudomonas sp. MDT2-39-1]|uniref:alpha/beta hydrolase n=1 Tax=Pseudomonas sp. BGI-2 TaxID=2528211 RepID=UPI0026BB27FA